MVRHTSLALMLLVLWPVFALAQQGEIRGKLIDSKTGDPLVGATITLTGTRIGGVSDATGNYVVSNVPAGRYVVRAAFVGYVNAQKSVTVETGTVTLNFTLEPTVIQAGEVIIEANRAKERETPVAFSDVSKMTIQEKIHGQDAPLLTQSVPGVFAYSTDGVGNGEAKLFVRGFNQSYVQVLVNGVPTNDPESNAVYWSNWGSVSGAAASMQVQRGAGSSLYGSGAFGGSFNIITSEAPARPYYGVRGTIGNPMASMYGLEINTGLINNTFAASVAVDRKIAEGSRVSGRYEGLNYYMSLAWFPTEQQSVKFVLHGAPQEHGYSWSNPIAYFKQFGYDANPAPFLPRSVVGKLPVNGVNGAARYGLLDGARELVDPNYVNLSHNFYHKSQAELHYRYDLSPVSAISATAFYSMGRGGGSSLSSAGTVWRLNSDGTVFNLYGPDGFIDNVATARDVYLVNAFQRISYSFHQQGGILARFETMPVENLKLTLGGEYRRWSADHPGHFTNIYGKTSSTYSYARRDTAGAVMSSTFSRRIYQGDLEGPTSDVGSIFAWGMASALDPTYRTQYRNYRGETPQSTIFAQGNWSFENLTLLASIQWVWYSYKLREFMPSESAIGQMIPIAQATARGIAAEGPTGKKTFIMRGTDNRWYEFPLVDTTRTRNFWQPKVGLNYNLTENINAYANVAHVERFVDLGVFYNYGRPNYAAPDEKSNQYEVGAGWTSENVKVKVNGYHMSWDNKVTRIRDVGMAGTPGYDYQGYISLQVGSAVFKGIEGEIHLDLAPVGAKNLEFITAASFMSNRWTGVNEDIKKDLTGARRPFNTGAVGPDGKTFTMYFDQLENTPVASGPQTMVYLGLQYDDGSIFGGVNAIHYAQQFVLDGGTYMATDGYFTGNLGVLNTFISSFAQKLPPRSVYNFNLGARFKLGALRGNASVQVLNAFDNQYLEDADRNGVYPGIGRAIRLNMGIGL